MRQIGELQSVTAISYNISESFETQIEERLGVEALEAVIMNFDSDCIEEYESLVADLDWGDVRFKPKKYVFDMKNRESLPAKLSIEEALKSEIKHLPPNLRYEFLVNNDTSPLIIA